MHKYSRYKRPKDNKKASQKFGSSTIVVCIEASKQPDGKYLSFTDNGREYTGKEVIEWAMEVEELGAGEIIITSVDREGTGKGFDIELTKKVTSAVSIPVITHGGCGKKEDVVQLFSETKSHSVAIASLIHYDCFKEHKSFFNANDEGNIDFLKSGKIFSSIQPTNIKQIKEELKKNNIPCRYI